MASEPIVCHSYGHAHKHPAVIGKIAGWTLPTPVTPTQLGVFVGTFIVLLVTNRLWGVFAPGFVRLVVLGGAPIVLAWAVRHLRVEGRSPVQMASGLFALATAPRTGTLFGRTYRGWRRQPARGARLYFAAGPDAPAGQEWGPADSGAGPGASSRSARADGGRMSGRDSAGNASGWEEAHPRAAAALAALVRLVERLGSALAPGRAGGGAP